VQLKAAKQRPFFLSGHDVELVIERVEMLDYYYLNINAINILSIKCTLKV